MKKHRIKKRIIFLFLIILGVILIRIFLFDPFKVSSSSMAPTIRTGDWVIVSKISYGPRVPKNYDEYPFGILFQALFREKEKFKWSLKDYTRLPGITSPRRDDIVLIKNPQNLVGIYLKRIIGLPGEYIIVGDDSLKVMKNRDSVSILVRAYPLKHITTSQDTAVNKTVYIPRKGDLISFDANTTDSVFLHLIFKFENIDTSSNSYQAFKSKLEPYKIKLNYFFVLGDNINQSIDSRSFGVVPETCLIGKAVFNVSRFKRL